MATQAALDRHVHEFAPRIAWSIGALYGFLALTWAIGPRADVPALVAALWTANCLVLVGLGFVHKAWFPPRLSHLTVALVILVALHSFLWLLWITAEFAYTAVLYLIMIGAGVMMLSVRVTAGLIAACLLGWAYVAWHRGGPDVWANAGYTLLAAGVVAAIAQAMRVRTYHRLEDLRERDAERLRAEAAERERIAVHEAEVQRLKRQDEFKTNFMNIAAHELSTPLTPIQLQLHILRTRQGIPQDQQRRALDIVARNMDRLAALVADLLQGANIQAGRLRMEKRRLDLAEVVRQAAEAFAPAYQDRGVELEVEVAAAPVEGDAQRLSQVVMNLLSNAMKFTPRGGHVRASLRHATRSSADAQGLVTETPVVELAVEDDGPGISPEDMPRLFQPFARLGDASRTAGGTGLGLYISRNIAHLHGGDLTVHSAGAGKGTTFTLSLPHG